MSQTDTMPPDEFQEHRTSPTEPLTIPALREITERAYIRGQTVFLTPIDARTVAQALWCYERYLNSGDDE